MSLYQFAPAQQTAPSKTSGNAMAPSPRPSRRRTRGDVGPVFVEVISLAQVVDRVECEPDADGDAAIVADVVRSDADQLLLRQQI